jgi:hypothetical protein
VIACYAIEPRSIERCATEKVAATHHEPNLHANTDELADFKGQLIQYFGIDTEGFLAG